MSTRTQRQEEEIVARTSADPAVLMAGGSVLLAWYYYFVQRNRQMGIFVGLWPPTVLAFASYFKQKRTSDLLERSGVPGIRESVERMVRGR